MNLGIDGKRVLVLGGSKGIGASTAHHLAEEGAHVTVVGRTRTLLESLTRALPGEEKNHSFIDIDLMNTETRLSFCNEFLSNDNIYDIVVHCIGGVYRVREIDGCLDDWIQEWIYNVGIAIDINKSILPGMAKKKWGRIIHVSSISAKMLRGSILYSCSKSYLNSYITTMGRHYADTGVVISGVMPGAVEFPGGYWDKIRGELPDKYHGFLKEHQAIGRMGKPEEIASLIMFLASEQCTFCPGVLFPIDGGAM